MSGSASPALGPLMATCRHTAVGSGRAATSWPQYSEPTFGRAHQQGHQQGSGATGSLSVAGAGSARKEETEAGAYGSLAPPRGPSPT